MVLALEGNPALSEGAAFTASFDVFEAASLATWVFFAFFSVIHQTEEVTVGPRGSQASRAQN